MFNWLIEILQRLFGAARKRRTTPFPGGTGPARIIILRHAEKTGDKSDPHLSAEGEARAQTLATYIPTTFGKPDFLIAARSSKTSRRPVATLEPLADVLKLEIMETFDDEDSTELVAHLRDTAGYNGSFCVICWRHSDIPELAGALGAPDGSYPAPWPRELYDAVIEIVYGPGGAVTGRRLAQPF